MSTEGWSGPMVPSPTPSRAATGGEGGNAVPPTDSPANEDYR